MEKVIKETIRFPVYGKLYYDTGEIKYVGYYVPAEYNKHNLDIMGRGVCYYKNGTKYREGQFQRGGLLEGKEYYRSGELKFEGCYNSREINGSYYGPPYPINGKYYDEDGDLIYEGDFKIIHQGGVGFPKVIFPEGFGSLK